MARFIGPRLDRTRGEGFGGRGRGHGHLQHLLWSGGWVTAPDETNRWRFSACFLLETRDWENADLGL